MALKKKKGLTLEQKLERQKNFNAILVRRGVYTYKDGFLVPTQMGYDEGNSNRKQAEDELSRLEESKEK